MIDLVAVGDRVFDESISGMIFRGAFILCGRKEA